MTDVQFGELLAEVRNLRADIGRIEGRLDTGQNVHGDFAHRLAALEAERRMVRWLVGIAASGGLAGLAWHLAQFISRGGG